MSKTFDERFAEAKDSVPALSPQQASRFKEENPDVLFIDPRSMDDIRQTTGFIPGALSVPLDDIDHKPDTSLPHELSTRGRTIITACQGGPIGALAAHALQRRGYSDVYYIEGGTQGWLDAGYVTER